MWTLLLYLGFHCCWPVLWWDLPSGWLTVRLYPHEISYAVVQVLAEQTKPHKKTVLKQAKTKPLQQQQQNQQQKSK